MSFSPINTVPKVVMSDTDAPMTARNGGNDWTEAETRELYKFRLRGNFKTHQEIGARLGRSAQACRLRLMKLKNRDLGPQYADLDTTKTLDRLPKEGNKTTATRRSRAPKSSGDAARKVRKTPRSAVPETPNLRAHVRQLSPTLPPPPNNILTEAANGREQNRIDFDLADQPSSSFTPINLTGVAPTDPENLAWLYQNGMHETAERLIRRAEEERISPENRARLARWRSYDIVGQLIRDEGRDRV